MVWSWKKALKPLFFWQTDELPTLSTVFRSSILHSNLEFTSCNNSPSFFANKSELLKSLKWKVLQAQRKTNAKRQMKNMLIVSQQKVSVENGYSGNTQQKWKQWNKRSTFFVMFKEIIQNSGTRNERSERFVKIERC